MIVFGYRIVIQMIHNTIIDRFLGYHIKHTPKFLGAQDLSRFLKFKFFGSLWAMNF